MKKIVLDTNVLLISISSRSKAHWLFQRLRKDDFTLCVTTDILAEYAEVIERHMGAETAEATLRLLENLPNLLLITTYYRFRLLPDPDDDKFADCAVAANADFIVSHDRDFDLLKKVDFPKILVIDTRQLEALLAG